MDRILMDSHVWKSWRDFNKTVSGRKIVFFGVSDDWTAKTFQRSKLELDYLVDNNPALIGAPFHEWEVKSPEVLKTPQKDRYVVITSGAYESIYPQLIEYGLEPGRDFCITPALNNLRIITEIHDHKATLLLSSPDHKIYTQLDKTQKAPGGGLYTYQIESMECKKVLDGTFHQIIDFGKGYYVTDEKRGICEISYDFKLIDTFGGEKEAISHGIAFCPERNLVFLGCTGMDKVSVYDAATKKLAFEIKLSEKWKKTRRSQHWLNDLCVRGDYLYISLFSHSGAYLEGVYDGGILQVSLENPEERNVLIRNAWMPHTVRFFESDLCYLDSMNGNLCKSNKHVIGEFNGFVRGLAHDGAYYYVGQSETRYFDRLKGIKKNIAMSAGFYLFDDETKAAKFFAVPQVRQIHDLCVIKS